MRVTKREKGPFDNLPLSIGRIHLEFEGNLQFRSNFESTFGKQRVHNQTLGLYGLMSNSSHFCGGGTGGPCFAMQYLVPFLVLQ